jgi:hypothetical protein
MLSAKLLELLRDGYRIAHPAIWLFPGHDPLLPMTTRKFNRVVHAAAAMAEMHKPEMLRMSNSCRQYLEKRTWLEPRLKHGSRLRQLLRSIRNLRRLCAPLLTR